MRFLRNQYHSNLAELIEYTTDSISQIISERRCIGRDILDSIHYITKRKYYNRSDYLRSYAHRDSVLQRELNTANAILYYLERIRTSLPNCMYIFPSTILDRIFNGNDSRWSIVYQLMEYLCGIEIVKLEDKYYSESVKWYDPEFCLDKRVALRKEYTNRIEIYEAIISIFKAKENAERFCRRYTENLLNSSYYTIAVDGTEYPVSIIGEEDTETVVSKYSHPIETDYYCISDSMDRWCSAVHKTVFDLWNHAPSKILYTIIADTQDRPAGMIIFGMKGIERILEVSQYAHSVEIDNSAESREYIAKTARYIGDIIASYHFQETRWIADPSLAND